MAFVVMCMMLLSAIRASLSARTASTNSGTGTGRTFQAQRRLSRLRTGTRSASTASRQTVSATTGLRSENKAESKPGVILAGSRSCEPQLASDLQKWLLCTHADTQTRSADDKKGADSEPQAWVAYVPTASMYLKEDSSSTRSEGERRRRLWANARKRGRQLEERLGTKVETIDLMRSKDQAELQSQMQGAKAIYVDGGNTFHLLHHIRSSGFDSVCTQMVNDGCIYVGVSAGAIVAGSSIRTAFWKGWDDPLVVDTDWSKEENLRGLNLVPDHAFFPHYDEVEHLGLVRQKREELGERDRLVLLGDHDTFML